MPENESFLSQNNQGEILKKRIMRYLAQQTVRIGSIERAHRLITTFFGPISLLNGHGFWLQKISFFKISEIVISVKSIEKRKISNLCNFFAIKYFFDRPKLGENYTTEVFK